MNKKVYYGEYTLLHWIELILGTVGKYLTFPNELIANALNILYL